MATTDKILYGTSTAITCTFASLASSATAGQGCAAVDNSTNLFDDALLTIGVKTAGTQGSDNACYIYLFGSEDGTVYNASSAEAVGTNAAVTLDSITNLKGPFVLSCPVTATTYRTVISVASAFGGVLPRKWGFVLRNYTGAALDSTEANHQKTYTGIYYQNV